jgi:hypothetical protein
MRVLLLGAPLALSFAVACGGPTPPAATPTDLPRATAPAAARGQPGFAAENHSPAADMATELGGMRLGMTALAFASACRATGAKDIPNERDRTILCTVPPEPLRADTTNASLDGVVVGAFCGPATTVCELAYVVYGKLPSRDEQIRAIFDDLHRRYGPPTATEGHAGSDPARECAAGQSAVHFVRSWSFGREQKPPHPLGRIRLVFDCDQRGGQRESDLTLVYDDEDGIARPSSNAN